MTLERVMYFASDAPEEETQNGFDRFPEEAGETPDIAITRASIRWGKADWRIWLVIDGKLAWRLD